VPVFVVIAMAFESTIRTVWERLLGRAGRLILLVVVALLLIWSGSNNYDLVFNQYYNIYLSSSWNTSEIGELAKLFIDTQGSPETTYLVGYPYWVDSRLVAINAGYPGLDFAIFTDQIPDTAEDPRAKMFFLNVNDEEDMALLQDLYPNGTLSRYASSAQSKDFMIFSVPPVQGVLP
jgi:hypothetical protein